MGGLADNMIEMADEERDFDKFLNLEKRMEIPTY